jgi:putative sterol carrier protein
MSDPKTSFEQEIPARIEKDPDKSKSVGAIFLFKVSGDDGGTWTVDLKENPGVREGDEGKADCTIELSSDDWRTVSENPSEAMKLYFSGKLKVSGNAMLATKLQQILG